MYCKNCGTLINEGALFCHNCGKEIKTAEPKVDTNEQDIIKSEVNVQEQNPSPFAQPMADAPVNTPTTAQKNEKSDRSALAVASLVLGIVSLLPLCCVNTITAVLGLIFGIISIKSSKRGMAIAGIILSVIAIVAALVTLFISFIGMMRGVAASPDLYNFFNEFVYDSPMYY